MTCAFRLGQVLENSSNVLASMGGQMGDILSLTQFSTDMAQLMDATDIRKEFFTAPFPVTTTVEISRLYHPDLTVEISAIAEIPAERFHWPKE